MRSQSKASHQVVLESQVKLVQAARQLPEETDEGIDSRTSNQAVAQTIARIIGGIEMQTVE